MSSLLAVSLSGLLLHALAGTSVGVGPRRIKRLEPAHEPDAPDA